MIKLILFILFYINQFYGFEFSEESFNIPIHNLDSPQIESLIFQYSKDLSEKGIFLIKNFYSKDTLGLLRKKALNDAAQKGVRRDIYKSVLGDQTDESFPPDHPRNILGNLKMTFVGKSDLPTEMTNLYTYKPLIRFLEKILQNLKFDSSKTHQIPWENLYNSEDAEGSVYVFLGGDGDRGEWHLDQHPFSCIHMLSKPNGGGRLYYAHHPPLREKCLNENEEKICSPGEFLWDWKIFEKIQRNEFESLKEEGLVDDLESQEGDVYCFQGNVTWHASGPIWGDKTRAILVMAYSDIPNFEHSQHVHELNAWGKHSEISEKCNGNENCVEHDSEIKSSATDAIFKKKKKNEELL